MRPTYIQPLLLLFLSIAAAGLVRLRNAKGKSVVVCGIAGLMLLSWPPVDWLLSRPLEAPYPVRLVPAVPAPQAIVVLSANVHAPLVERPFALPDAPTVERCTCAAWLHRQWPTLPVLACGGSGRNSREPFSVTMRGLLRGGGVPEDLIWTEEQSHSTYENALYGARILRRHGITQVALVVDARSMPRAAACFRKQGIDVLPAPSSFREWGPLVDELIPGVPAIASNELTLHETLGLAWYWLHGWI